MLGTAALILKTKEIVFSGSQNQMSYNSELNSRKPVDFSKVVAVHIFTP